MLKVHPMVRRSKKHEYSMKLVRTLHFFLFVAVLGSLQAQDLHYTLFNMSPLSLNPANTGAFLGTVRVGGIYRGQWWAASDRGYNTPGGYVDAPIIRGFRDQDWVGVGAYLLQDRSGSIRFTTRSNGLSGAYHLGLDKKGESVLTLGVQIGSITRSLRSQDILLGSNFDAASGIIDAYTAGDDPAVGGGGGTGGGGGGQMNANDNDVSNSYLDIRAGLLFKQKIDDFDNFEAGVAFGHVNVPDYTFGGGGGVGNPGGGGNTETEDRQPLLISTHARYEWALNKKWSAAPTVLWQTMRGQHEVNLQAWAGYDLKPEEQIKVHMGLGYRVGDAAKILAGLDYKDLRVAAAFDLNVSQYRTVTDFQGAFEIAAWYIFKIYKEPEIKPAILCPQF